MLIDDIAKLTKYYKKINSTKKKEKEISSFEQFNQRIETFIKRAESLKEVYNNLCIEDEYKVENLFMIQPDFSDILELIDKYIQNINDSVILSKNDADKIQMKLNEIETPLKNEWSEYVDKNIQNAKNLINMISPLIGEYKSQNLIEDIENYKNRWPVSEREIIKFKSNLSKCEEAIKELDITEEVQEFLLRVMDGIATIENLNEEILYWIKQHNFSTKLYINFS